MNLEDFRMTDLDGIGVYVGTYHKYNCGSIYGMWVDLEKCGDEETFWEVCRELHKDEDDPEYMFQDYQCFPRKYYEESHLDLEAIFEWLELDEDDRNKVVEFWDEDDENASIDDILEMYIGKDLDLEAMAEEEVELLLASTTYSSYGGRRAELPSWLTNNIDYKGIAEDLFDEYIETKSGYWFDKSRV